MVEVLKKMYAKTFFCKLICTQVVLIVICQHLIEIHKQKTYLRLKRVIVIFFLLFVVFSGDYSNITIVF